MHPLDQGHIPDISGQILILRGIQIILVCLQVTVELAEMRWCQSRVSPRFHRMPTTRCTATAQFALKAHIQWARPRDLQK